jgi:hypothetical protein
MKFSYVFRKTIASVHQDHALEIEGTAKEVEWMMMKFLFVRDNIVPPEEKKDDEVKAEL